VGEGWGEGNFYFSVINFGVPNKYSLNHSSSKRFVQDVCSKVGTLVREKKCMLLEKRCDHPSQIGRGCGLKCSKGCVAEQERRSVTALFAVG